MFLGKAPIMWCCIMGVMDPGAGTSLGHQLGSSPGLSACRFILPVKLINLIAITPFIGMTAFQCLDLPM